MAIDRIEVLVTDLTLRLQRETSSGPYDTGPAGTLLGTPLMLLPHRAQAAAAEHARIVEAIQKRDPEAAEEAARKHVHAAQRERLKRLFPESAA